MEVFYGEIDNFLRRAQNCLIKGRLFYSVALEETLHYREINGLLGRGNHHQQPETTINQCYQGDGHTYRQNINIGAFNAVVAESFAELQNEFGVVRRVQTNPYTNYNTLVVDQNLKNNSYVTFVNTNVWRQGSRLRCQCNGWFLILKPKPKLFCERWCCVWAKSIIPILQTWVIRITSRPEKVVAIGHEAAWRWICQLWPQWHGLPLQSQWMVRIWRRRLYPICTQNKRLQQYSFSLNSVYTDFMNLIASVILPSMQVVLYSGKAGLQ